MPLLVTDPETIMYDRAQSKGYVDFGITFNVGHKCTKCGHEFAFAVQEFWYETNPKNKIFSYFVIDKVCPKCHSPEISLTEDIVAARDRAKAERRAAAEAERAAKGEKPVEEAPVPEPEEVKPKRKRNKGEEKMPSQLPPKKKKGGKR